MRPRAARAEHREAVVLAGDLDAAGGEVLDRVVGAAVAERQLVGLQADRAAQQLVAEADAVDRQLADELADRLDDVVERGRVAGAVGQEHGVGRRGRAAPRRAACTGAARRVAPRARRLRTIESLTPVSIMAIDAAAPPCAVEGRARSARPGSPRARGRARPSSGSAAISARASSSATRAGKTPPRIAPGVADVAHERAGVEVGDRRDRRSRAASRASRPRRRARPRGSTAARMIAARAWTRSDSIASALTRRSCRSCG